MDRNGQIVLLAVGIFVASVVVVGIGVAGGFDYDPKYGWVYNYQNLIAGILALGGAVLVVLHGRKQLEETRRQADAAQEQAKALIEERRLRRRKARADIARELKLLEQAYYRSLCELQSASDVGIQQRAKSQPCLPPFVLDTEALIEAFPPDPYDLRQFEIEVLAANEDTKSGSWAKGHLKDFVFGKLAKGVLLAVDKQNEYIENINFGWATVNYPMDKTRLEELRDAGDKAQQPLK